MGTDTSTIPWRRRQQEAALRRASCRCETPTPVLSKHRGPNAPTICHMRTYHADICRKETDCSDGSVLLKCIKKTHNIRYRRAYGLILTSLALFATSPPSPCLLRQSCPILSVSCRSYRSCPVLSRVRCLVCPTTPAPDTDTGQSSPAAGRSSAHLWLSRFRPDLKRHNPLHVLARRVTGAGGAFPMPSWAGAWRGIREEPEA